jgi:hypothetical protein
MHGLCRFLGCDNLFSASEYRTCDMNGINGIQADLASFVHCKLQQNAVGIEVTELAALVCGVFLLRRQNWARWLALAWMAFHVALSAFHPLGELAVHVAFLVMFGWVLLGREANRWFSRAGASWLDRPVMPK